MRSSPSPRAVTLIRGVTYTCIGTHFDPFIQPPEVAFLEVLEDDDPDRVRNIWVEDDNSAGDDPPQ